MSSSGVVPINSGPLLIRTYLDGSSNDTYILGQYDLPISSNFVMITSSNGQMVPSNSVYISTISGSSIIGSTILFPLIIANNINTSTLYGSTITITSTTASSMIGSSLQTKMVYMSSIETSTLSTSVISYSSILGSTLLVNNITLTTFFNAPSSNIWLSTISCTNANGNGILTSNNVSTTYLSTNTLTISSLSTTYLSTNMAIVSSFSTNNISFLNSIGDIYVLSSLTINSTINISTISTTNFSFINLIGNSDSSNFTASSVNVSSLITSSMSGSTILYSTIIGSTTTSKNLYHSTFHYSTLSGSTFTTPDLIASTINGSTLYGSSFYVSTLIGSSIVTNYATYSTLLTSTLNNTSILIGEHKFSKIIGSTINTSTLYIGSTFVSTLNGSSLIVSTLSASSVNGSTFLGNISYSYQLSTSSVSVSSLWNNVNVTSTITLTTLFISSLYGSTLQASTVLLSSINTMMIGQGKGNIATNTVLGYNTLVNNTGNNNTAFGYGSMTSNTSGSYNTSLGVSTLYYNTSGSYNTTIGANSGVYNGSIGDYNTYIGHSVYPSGANVTNEIIIGGSSTLNGNIGNGSNSITLGNPQISSTRIYGTIGIGTNAPTTTLDVRGSYQQIGGNMSITNNGSLSTSINIFNDNTNGCVLFLNSGTQNADGGPTTATLRNDYGILQLQGSQSYNTSNGIRIIDNGSVGINTTSINYKLDVNGTGRFIDNLTINGNYGIKLSGYSSNSIYTNSVNTYNPVGANNLMIQSWWGLGFQSSDNAVRIAFDTRTGNANVVSTITASTFVGSLTGNCTGFVTNVTGGSIQATSGTFTSNVIVNDISATFISAPYVIQNQYSNINPTINSVFATGFTTNQPNKYSLNYYSTANSTYSNFSPTNSIPANTIVYLANPSYDPTNTNVYDTRVFNGSVFYAYTGASSGPGSGISSVRCYPISSGIFCISYFFPGAYAFISKNLGMDNEITTPAPTSTSAVLIMNSDPYQINSISWTGYLSTSDYICFGAYYTSAVTSYLSYGGYVQITRL